MTAPAARTAPPAIIATVETVAWLLAFESSWTAALFVQAVFGQRVFELDSFDMAMRPKTDPTASPTTPTPPATRPTVRCVEPFDCGGGGGGGSIGGGGLVGRVDTGAGVATALGAGSSCSAG